MSSLNARLAGVELYFEDLAAARDFYQKTLGLHLSGERVGHLACDSLEHRNRMNFR